MRLTGRGKVYPGWRLGFRQSSFSRIARVPTARRPYASARPLVSWHALVPFTFQIQVSHQTQKYPPNSSRLRREYDRAPRGAGWYMVWSWTADCEVSGGRERFGFPQASVDLPAGVTTRAGQALPHACNRRLPVLGGLDLGVGAQWRRLGVNGPPLVTRCGRSASAHQGFRGHEPCLLSLSVIDRGAH